MTLLDIAGFGFSHYAGAFLGLLGKVFLGGLGLAFGALLLLIVSSLAIVGIVVFATIRGIEHGSLIKATGIFFRLVGLAGGLITGMVLLPVALLLKASLLTGIWVAFIAIAAGYFAGFIISEIIALRLWKYEFYIRVFNNLRYKINGLGNE